jgi:hypothetical protein
LVPLGCMVLSLVFGETTPHRVFGEERLWRAVVATERSSDTGV